jgi:hypothetical protein
MSHTDMPLAPLPRYIKVLAIGFVLLILWGLFA